jgi:hypothetical protein
MVVDVSQGASIGGLAGWRGTNFKTRGGEICWTEWTVLKVCFLFDANGSERERDIGWQVKNNHGTEEVEAEVQAEAEQ